MKKCPNCGRTFEDETLSFCLEDGALLSASYDPEATVVRGAGDPLARDTDPNISTVTRVSPQLGTASPEVDPVPGQKSIAPHLVYAVAGFLAIVVFAGIVGGFIWMASRDKDSTQNRNVDSNRKTENVRPSPTPTKDIGKPDVLGPRMTDTALDGTNLTYYPSQSVDQCESDCARNGNCKGYAWIKAGTYNPGDSAMCYLLSAVTKTVPARGHISAVKGSQ